MLPLRMTRRSGSLLSAVAVMFASLPADASPYNLAAVSAHAITPSAPPTDAEVQTFATLRGEIEELDDEDVDALLTKCEQALRALPEHASSQGKRREVVVYVGDWEIEKRTNEQLRRSIEVLRLYQTQLRGTYGEAATSRPDWQTTEGYIDGMLARIGDEGEADGAPPIAPTPASPVDTAPRSRAASPLVVSGGVLTGVGGVLLVAGLAFYGRSFARYNKLHDDYDRGMPVTPEHEKSAWTRIGASWAITIPGVLVLGAGIGLLVVGLRRRAHDRSHRASFDGGQMGIRF